MIVRMQEGSKLGWHAVMLCGLIWGASAAGGAEPVPDDAGQFARGEARVAAPRGRLTGRFVVSGSVPRPRTFDAWVEEDDRRQPGQRPSGVALTYRAYTARGLHPRDESLLADADGGLANVLVWREAREAVPSDPARATPPLQLRIKDGQFVPRVFGILVGQEIVVTNTDPDWFNVRIQPQRNDAFNVLVMPGQSRTWTAIKPEKTPILLESTAQIWARGALVVLPHANWAVTETDGRFTLPDLPSGRSRFRAWHERSGWLPVQKQDDQSFEIDIQPGANDIGQVTIPIERFQPPR